MKQHTPLNPRVTKEALAKTSEVIAGQRETIFQNPFCHSKYVGLKEMLENVILPAKGKELKDFPNVSKLLDVGIRISSHKGISRTSERSKFNLLVSSHLSDSPESVEGFIIEI